MNLKQNIFFHKQQDKDRIPQKLPTLILNNNELKTVDWIKLVELSLANSLTGIGI